MVATCDFQFHNNPQGTYFSGQFLSGNVTLKLDKPMEVKAALLKISGHATTSWSKKEFGKNRHYGGREDYLATLTYLFGSENSTKVTIPAGTHQFEFSCQLPSNCPTSFEGISGHIRYTVKIILDRPWKRDQVFTQGFTVLNVMDLNQADPLTRLPITERIQKTYCCWLCQSDPLKVEATLEQSCFVPGQSIPITVLAINDSNVPVEEIEISLVLVATCFDETSKITSTSQYIPVTKLKGAGVPRNCTKLYDYKLDVPATPPTCLTLSKLIHLTYEIHVEMVVKGTHSSQVLVLPVTIGNIPLMNKVEEELPSGSNGRNFKPSKEDLAKNIKEKESMEETKLPWSANEKIAPRNYSEAVHITNSDDNLEESNYRPLYPIFDLSTLRSQIDALSKTNEGERKY